MSKDIILGFVGDLHVNRESPAKAFRPVTELLQVPDILFGHLEGSFSDAPRPVPNGGLAVGAPVANLDVFAEVGFDVLSLAGNHVLDLGYEAMLATRDRLLASGVRPCGIGVNEAQAREPVIIATNGLRIAYLAYATVFPMGYEAAADRPGLAAVRAVNFWHDAFPGYYQPGCPPALTMVPNKEDLAKFADDIRGARSNADLVVTSFHWGDFSRPFHLTDHERDTARFAIDQGADMVVGHHHHTLRGMEWYRGKPILYGLGHFIADLQDLQLGATPMRTDDKDETYELAPRQGWPRLPMHGDSRMTMLACARAGPEGIGAIGVIPCRLDPEGHVHPVHPGDPEGRQITAYLQKCVESQGLNGAFETDDNLQFAGFPALSMVPLPG